MSCGRGWLTETENMDRFAAFAYNETNANGTTRLLCGRTT